MCCSINKYYPPIFKCMSPQWAYSFFKHNRHTGWEMLAGIFLSGALLLGVVLIVLRTAH